MTNTEEPRRKPICPSCGQPVKSSVLDRVKFIFFTLALGYVGLSMILLMMSVPAELRRNKTNQPVPWDSWMQPLSNELFFQIFVGGGVATGVLLIYWD